MNEQEIRDQICEVGKRLWMKGWVGANDGNISMRLGDEFIITTPIGTSKGFLTPDMIAVVDETGKQIGGQWPRYHERYEGTASEWWIGLARVSGCRTTQVSSYRHRE